MGGNLCTLRQSCFTESPTDDADEDVPTDARENSTLEFLNPTSLKSEAKGEDIGKDVKRLEQWILASPCINTQDSMDASRVQQLFRQSAKVSALSYERVYSTPRESFSTDWPSGGESVGSCSRRSVSGKSVRFKLPEDADIHIFYVCNDDEKEETE